MTALRKSRPGDVRELRKLWEIVFGPEEAFTEVFFREVYRPGSAAVAEENGVIVSAAYSCSTLTAYCIYFVYEYYTGTVFLSLVEKVTHS